MKFALYFTPPSLSTKKCPPAEERGEMRILIGFVLLLVTVIQIQSDRHRCWQMPLASDYWLHCIMQSNLDPDVIGINASLAR
jgi:hypothetical protein